MFVFQSLLSVCFKFSLRPDKNGSEQIYQHYGQPGRVDDRKCDETHYPDICSFQVTESGNHKLSCDAKVCWWQSDIQIASVNPEMGKAVSDWKTLPKETLTAAVQEAVKTNLERGFSFLFLRCGTKFGSIFQALTFPPTLKKVVDGKSKRSIDINVVMLDSISRPHFYRIMPRAVEALRKIVQDSKIKATALDFELVQSIGQQTFENLRPFFSGVLKGEHSNLYSRFLDHAHLKCKKYSVIIRINFQGSYFILRAQGRALISFLT